MCVRSSFLGVLIIVFSFLLVRCSTQYENRVVYTSEDYWNKELPLQCYDCSSENDPRCGDPFNDFTIGRINCTDIPPPEHLVNIGERPNNRLKPTVCRKIVQKVEHRTRVIRECGYIQDERDDKECVTRSGTKNVQVTYCACTHSLCNAGINIRPSLISVGFVLFPIVYLLFRY